MVNDKLFFITVDVEEDLGCDGSEPKVFEGVTKGLPALLEILDTFHVPATFFTTGEVAARYPEIVCELHEHNHEIACHGLFHRIIKEFDIPTNRQYILENVKIINELVGKKPCGYRAVNNVVDNNFMNLLNELGFNYDASVLSGYPPFKRYAGFEGATPKIPYHPNRNDYKRKGDNQILEMPISAIPIINTPWVATWIRTIGKSFYKFSASISKPTYVMFVLHSWDFINLKGKTAHSRCSGEYFKKIMYDLLDFFYSNDYKFLTSIDGSKILNGCKVIE